MDDKTLVELFDQAYCALMAMRTDHPEKIWPTSFVYPDEVRNNAETMREAFEALQSCIETLKADNARLVKANGLRMEELHKERKEAKLWFKQAQEWKACNEALGAALRGLLGNEVAEERIGWRGSSPSSPHVYQCEYCHKEHADCTEIEHLDDCPILAARQALAGDAHGHR